LDFCFGQINIRAMENKTSSMHSILCHEQSSIAAKYVNSLKFKRTKGIRIFFLFYRSLAL